MYRYAIGGNNGIAGNTDLSNNILGLNALGNRQPSAVNNVAIGFNSCGSQSSVGTSGGNNVSIGVGALTTLTSGSYNIGLGANALGNILTGNNNIGIGQNALKNTAIGNNNIVVGSNGSYSVNNNYCVNWVGRPSLPDANWRSITSGYVDDPASTIYGKTVFVAVGEGGLNRAATSLDGITWTLRTTSGTNGSNTWASVTYGKVNDLSANDTTYLGKSIFVACADTSGGSNLIMRSTDGITWEQIPAYADSTHGWTSITYGLVHGVGTFVACSIAGTNRIMTSTDGKNWTGRTAYADTSNNYTCITYGNGVFVALASYGLTPMYLSMASSDGITWTGVPTVNDNVHWVSVTYGLVNGQGLFVAVSDSMAPNFNVMTSTTGYSWTQRYITNTSSPWVSVTYGSLLINGQTDKGLFVAVAGNYDGAFPIGGSNHVMVSTDGINWINRRAYADTTANWYSVGYGVVNGVGRFVALAYSQQISNVVMTSDIIVPTIPNIESNNTLIGYNTSIQYTVQSDLSVWNKSVAPYLSTSNSWYGVAYGLVNGVDTYVGVLRTGSKRVVYSNDAVNWRLIDVSGINGTTQWNGIAYGNGRFVAVGNTRAMTSTDGSNNWTAVGLSTQLTNTTWTDIVYGNGKFVAVGNTSTTSPYYRVMTMPDGSNDFIPATTPTDTSGNWTSITYGNGVYVAVANGGTNRVMTSVDGSNNWTGKTVPLNNWNSVAYGLVDTSGVFVAVAQSGTNRVIRSIDNGTTWLSVTSIQDTSAIWTGVTYGLVNGTGIFAACAGNNVATSPKYIMTSPDGIIWTGQSGYATNALVNGYVNGRSTFVGVGDIGAVYSQEDTFSNSTAIGTNAQITASNQIVLGTANEMVVCPGGKVGIGTTSAGYYPLNVKGGLGRDLSGTVLALQNAANDYTGATTDIEFSNSNSFYRLGKISAIDIQSTSNSTFLGALALSCGYNVGYIEGIRIKPNPNVSNSALVGIGTPTPGANLEIQGPTATGTNTQVNITSWANGNTTTNTSTLNFRVQGAGQGMTNNTIVGKYFPVTTGYYGLAFNPNGVNVMNVINNGTVCIGTSTPNPNATLTVSDKIGVVSSLNNVLGLFSASDGNYLHIGAWNEAGSTSKNIVLNQYGGNVGIGTTSPLATLHVKGTTNYQYNTVYDYDNSPWVKIGIWDCSTNYADPGCTLKITLLSSKGFDNSNPIRVTQAGGETLIFAKCLNNSRPLSTSNIAAYWYHTGGDSNVTDVVFIQDSRYKFKVYAKYTYVRCPIIVETTKTSLFTTSDILETPSQTVDSSSCYVAVNQMTVMGKVGIGTTDPKGPLHVQVNTSTTEPNNSALNGIFIKNETNSANNNASVCVQNGGINGGNAFLSVDIADNTGWSMGIDNTDSCKFKIMNSWNFTSKPYLTIETSNGNVGIGKTSPAVKLDVSGQVNATSFNVPSDYRIKKNVQLLHDVSYNIDNLKPVTYTNDMTQKTDMGFIAHELQEEFPFLVTGEKDGKNNQTVNYIGLIALLVKEVQDLKQEVKMLRNQCNHTNL